MNCSFIVLKLPSFATRACWLSFCTPSHAPPPAAGTAWVSPAFDRAEKEALANELNDLREMMAAEATSRAALQDALAAAERQLGEARNELDMTKTVSDCHPTSVKPK